MRIEALIISAVVAVSMLSLPTQAEAKDKDKVDKIDRNSLETEVPELDASGAFAAFALVGAGALLLSKRRRASN
jgi:hypothetical protein